MDVLCRNRPFTTKTDNHTYYSTTIKIPDRNIGIAECWSNVGTTVPTLDQRCASLHYCLWWKSYKNSTSPIIRPEVTCKQAVAIFKCRGVLTFSCQKYIIVLYLVMDATRFCYRWWENGSIRMIYMGTLKIFAYCDHTKISCHIRWFHNALISRFLSGFCFIRHLTYGKGDNLSMMQPSGGIRRIKSSRTK